MTLTLIDTAEVADAAALLAMFGPAAAAEAATRADRSRDLGNHLHFCRWRQVGRLIALLELERPVGTVH